MQTNDYNELIKRFTSPDDDLCQAEAIALGQQGEETWPIITALLQDDEVDVRFWMVRALWANGTPEAIKQLKACLHDDEEMVRSGAILALGELKAESAIEDLVLVMSSDPGLPGNHAADALCKIGPASAPALIKALQHKQSWVRVRAAKTLIPLESREAIAPLFYLLEDESYVASHYAKEALARMGVGQMVYFKV